MPRRVVTYAPLLAALVLTLIFLYKLAFTDLILGRGDTLAYFYPYWDVRSAALLEGRLPLWTPDVFMGAPLLANPQLGTFYPPNWLTIAFNTPEALRVSILLHVFWAILGMYTLARRAVGLDVFPALVAGGLFGLGGYVGAHVEQINQLQGLAWMPWVFLLFDRALSKTGLVAQGRAVLLLGIGLGMQVFAGHTQTVFVTLVGLGVYGLLYVIVRGRGMPSPARWRFAGGAVLILTAGGLIALALTLPQIIPTAELTAYSNRRGGLNQQQAMAFSFSPLVMGRGLLPSYDGQLFGEYVAYIGVIGLGLALVGVIMGDSKDTARPSMTSSRLIWLVIALVGLILALGLYNPLYWLLASLPGFNLFRVPARWLALFALGAAVLAGIGAQTLLQREGRFSRRVLAAVLAGIGVLAAASLLTARAPSENIIGPALPTTTTLIGWGTAFVVLVFLIGAKDVLSFHPNCYRLLLLIAPLVELWLAAQVLPFNDLTPPEVVSSRRFTVSQIRVYAAEQNPPGRLLSISGLLFDPGDRDVLEARYRRMGLDDLSMRLAFVALKRQETLFPNAPLTWNIPSIDGFDGGLLPTIYYTAFTSLMIPPGELRTVDGRLGEILARPECRGACIPDRRLLDLTNTRYLLTDKVYDVVHEGIFYDTTFEIPLQPGQLYVLSRLPEFEASGLDILYTGEGCANGSCLDVTAVSAGQTSENLTLNRSGVEVGGLSLIQFDSQMPQKFDALRLETDSSVRIRALTLVDRRTGDFVQLTPDAWRRVLSSDIKLYENQEVLPRAFVVAEAQFVRDDALGTEDALRLMQDPAFDPAKTIVVSGDAETLSRQEAAEPSTAEILVYEAERVEIRVKAANEGYLLLTDAYYPGWKATVNGNLADIGRANVMFRVVRVPAGDSVVVFTFQPAWWPGVVVVGGLLWMAALGALILPGRRAVRIPDQAR